MVKVPSERQDSVAPSDLQVNQDRYPLSDGP
jgi:hypothetical protein